MKIWQGLLLTAIILLAVAVLVSFYFIATGPRM